MLLICQGCTTAYATGLERCPQCGSQHYREEGKDMPRINTQGVTDATQEDEDVYLRQPREAEAEPKTEQVEGGEQPSRGNSSSTSTDSKTSGTEKSETQLQKPVRPTARR